MRVHARGKKTDEGLRVRLSRLKSLPLRPATARSILAGLSDELNETDDAEQAPSDRAKRPPLAELDPGWLQSLSVVGGQLSPLERIAQSAWWSAAETSAGAVELLGRMWRHSAAVAHAARWFARDAGDPDAAVVARAGFLINLGAWAVAALEPEWLVGWWQEADPIARRRKEIDELGCDLNDLGRGLAERWGCDPLLIDAVWLNGEHGDSLRSMARDPRRLAHVQMAAGWAEKTPWAMGTTRAIQPIPSDPRMRILIAEVQVRCSSPFIATDATAHEERVSRQNARLRLRLSAVCRDQKRGERLAHALGESHQGDTLSEWASRAALSWCAEPDVSLSRVVWFEHDGSPASASETGGVPAPPRTDIAAHERAAPDVRIPLNTHGPLRAEIQLWGDRNALEAAEPIATPWIRAAWDRWAALVADRALLERRLQAVVAAYRDAVESEEARLRQRKLDALGVFAGGAGHELNNPLAVIAGRAQLMLNRTADAELARSLRIILDQAGRAHRILRDLMFVARAPKPRRRVCRLADVLNASLRELEPECAERGIHLVGEVDEQLPTACADPEALRHLADILLRNAIQATPAGGKILVKATAEASHVVWSFHDSGKGLGAEEAVHLFDPFYCGRQAGRGLGLGLPRAARIAELAGGTLRLISSPAHGSTFQVNLPVTAPSESLEPERPMRPASTASPS